MKYGLCYHKQTMNIGDDIWAVATSAFLPHIDYLIDYSEIAKFHSNDGEAVATIISGVPIIDTNKIPWIPSADIIPYFTSTCFHRQYTEYLNSDFMKNYFRMYQPIGSRDKNTVDIMNNSTIDAYFSGCVTMTMRNSIKCEQERKQVILVDVPLDIMKNIWAYKPVLRQNGLSVKIHSHYNKDIPNMTWNERTKLCEDSLKLYANAHCVITSRLHVALPCLALGTPVLIVKPRWDVGDVNHSRFIPFNSLVRFCFVDEFLEGKSEFNMINPTPNSDKFTVYRDKITSDLTN
ncbi:MAG: polysaccharide pyruvyl transferase family protein, partial [Oscillospiraceae bacterium]|nr:polysaccharide pyruvyl transferase family protein [Oscillospiraceae bacterium]